jgi:hypothetical protein
MAKKTGNKTLETQASVNTYLMKISDAKRRKDCQEIIDLIQKQTGFEPKMWGTAIVGFGSYHYKYESGREGDTPIVALSSRASAITLYMPSDFDKKNELLSKFGKHKAGKGCIYIQKLEDIDKGILSKMVKNSVEYRKTHD